MAEKRAHADSIRSLAQKTIRYVREQERLCRSSAEAPGVCPWLETSWDADALQVSMAIERCIEAELQRSPVNPYVAPLCALQVMFTRLTAWIESDIGAEVTMPDELRKLPFDARAAQAWEQDFLKTSDGVIQFCQSILRLMDELEDYSLQGLKLLRAAIKKHGKDAKPDVIITEAGMNESKARDLLRDLQEAGEYRGFTRRRSKRYSRK